MRGVPRQQHRDMQFQQHFSRLGLVHLRPNEVEGPKSFSIENAYLSGFWSGSVLRFDPGLKPRRCGFDPGFDRGKHEPKGPLTRKEWNRRLGSEPKDGGTGPDRYFSKKISMKDPLISMDGARGIDPTEGCRAAGSSPHVGARMGAILDGPRSQTLPSLEEDSNPIFEIDGGSTRRSRIRAFARG